MVFFFFDDDQKIFFLFFEAKPLICHSTVGKKYNMLCFRKDMENECEEIKAPTGGQTFYQNCLLGPDPEINCQLNQREENCQLI